MPCCITNLKGDLLKVNKEWENVWVKESGAKYCTNIVELIHQEEFNQKWDQLLSQNNNSNYTYQLKNKNSNYKAINIDLKQIQDYVFVIGNLVEYKKDVDADAVKVSIDNNINGIVWISQAGVIQYANKTFCNNLKYTQEELSHLKIFDLDRNLTEKVFKTDWYTFFLKDADISSCLYSEFAGKNGEALSVEIHIVSTKETRAKGLVILYVKFIQKDNESTQYKDKLHIALEYITEGIYWGNLYDIHFQYVNNGACNMLGYTKDELRKLSIFDVDIDFIEDDQRFNLDEFYATKGMKNISFEARHRKKNGEIIPVDVNSLFVWINSKPYALSFVRDITEQKNYEMTILKNERILRESQRVAKIGNFELSYKDRTVVWSDEVYHIFGYDKGELELDFDTLAAIMPEEDYFSVRLVIEKAAQENCFYEHEHRAVKKNGEVIYVFVSGFVEVDGNNNLNRVYGVIQDITDRHNYQKLLIEAKEKAEQSDVFKSTFIANVSHEIRTPMNAIIGFSTILKNGGNTPEEIEKYLDIIHNSGEHLLELINDIIDISKIESGQIKIVKSKVHIIDLLGELHEFFTSYLVTRGKDHLALAFNCADVSMEVETDEMRLKQILINLISNAIKFTDEGFVKVNCKRENDYLKFSVIDSGIGIPEDKRQLVFERFQQAKTTTEKIYGGTGLGLAIAKACVDLLGGQINIKSDVEKGAHFYFTIKI
nr:PAS domain-containing sensor histidine kinase [uncultured Carboxylicivirga sp.]